jgi:hypothetical protein
MEICAECRQPALDEDDLQLCSDCRHMICTNCFDTINHQAPHVTLGQYHGLNVARWHDSEWNCHKHRSNHPEAVVKGKLIPCPCA